MQECTSSNGSRPCYTKQLDINLQRKKFNADFKELVEYYENKKGKYIDMGQPRDVSYSFGGKKIVLHGEDERHTTSNGKSSSRSIPAEDRGITLRQLRAILPLIKRRCKKENWTRPVYKNGIKTNDVERVTPDNATMYDINEYIIKPFTEHSQKSFVETLPSTKRTQPPRWFVR